MAQNVVSINEIKGKVDFGIITIREDEFEAVLQRLRPFQLVTGGQRYAVSRVKTVSEDEYVVACVRCVEQGTAQAQDVARTMIDDLNPQWILVVGIAGSMPDSDYTLGDVLLASRLHDFSVSAIIENSRQEVRQEFASGGGPMHKEVQDLIALLPALNMFLEQWNTSESLTVTRPKVTMGKNQFYGEDNWKRKVRESLSRYFGKGSIRQHPKAFAGSVASSGILLKDTQTASQWLSTSRDIKGVEMELSGVYQAAHRYQKPVLAIRGISDIVGYRRSPDWTTYACHTAASFTLALLRSRSIIPLESQEALTQTASDTSDTPRNQQVGVFKDPPPKAAPLIKAETLFSNLLEVEYFPDHLYAVATECDDDRTVRALLRDESNNPPQDWIIRAKTLYAFHDFSDPIWKKICADNIPERHPTSHWADSYDRDRVSEFIELLKNCLKEFGKGREIKYIHTQKVRGKTKPFKYMYFAETRELARSPFFRFDDIKDIKKFAAALKEKETPLAKRLFELLPNVAQELLEEYPSVSDHELRKRVVNGLNEILKDPLYEPSLFEGVKVRWLANRLAEKEFLIEKRGRR
ncbi:MAG TPA: hypothetical protein VJ842_17220 [Pyrinomonadaceae bacterium]|nr:hypothetical protein [Pyrinomonadaceae bacterium]